MRRFVVEVGIVCVLALATCRTVAAVGEATQVVPGSKVDVTFDERSIILGGERVLLMSGGIHYTRTPPADWPRLFALWKELGLNTVQTYVMWNQHEPKKGESIWDGQVDLIRFLQAAQDAGLWVVLRIGPYVCGEFYYGGIPLWLRHEDNIGCYRCSDPVWKREAQRFVGEVVQRVTPMLAPNGGPIVMMQIENEYTGGDQDYLEWCVDMARNLTTQVPWNLCHDEKMCAKVNSDAGENVAICTINGFWMDVFDQPIPSPRQPAPAWFNNLRKNIPGQPSMWTEDQGWFDQWGVAQRVRRSDDQLYGIARALMYGMSYHNHYMGTGGNNYGRMAGGEVITAYAPDTVVDYLLFRHEPRFTYYKQFYHVVAAYAQDIVSSNITAPTPLKADQGKATLLEFSEMGYLVILANYGVDGDALVTYANKQFYLKNHSLVLVGKDSLKVLFNTSDAVDPAPSTGVVARASSGSWSVYKEPVGYATESATSASGPVDQLIYTENDSDYCWYSTNVSTELLAADSQPSVSITANGHCYAYVNGVNLGSTKETDLLVQDWDDSQAMQQLDILCAAGGLKNTGVSPKMTKGVTAVEVNGKSITGQPWTMRWNLTGEASEIFTLGGVDRVKWQEISSAPPANASLLWFKGVFDLPAAEELNVEWPLSPDTTLATGPAQPNQTAYALDLGSMSKGAAYVNGFNIGRYWLMDGKCTGDCAPPYHGKVCYVHWHTNGCGKPTQHIYHIPFSILKPTGNLVVLFDEDTPSGTQTSGRNPFDVKLVKLTNHPALD